MVEGLWNSEVGMRNSEKKELRIRNYLKSKLGMRNAEDKIESRGSMEEDGRYTLSGRGGNESAILGESRYTL